MLLTDGRFIFGAAHAALARFGECKQQHRAENSHNGIYWAATYLS